jgi:hypothetical protein
MTKEKPILFSAPMVRAILEGRKSQTRRTLKMQGEYADIRVECARHATKGLEYVATCAAFPGKGTARWGLCSSSFVPGDTLRVNETFQCLGRYFKNGLTENGRQRWEFFFHPARKVLYNPNFVASPREKEAVGYWTRPSIFMYRWASRITLRVTGLRLERVRDITDEDAIAEGIKRKDYEKPCCCFPGNPRGGYQLLWDSLNAKRGLGWDKNPWVWVVEFERI